MVITNDITNTPGEIAAAQDMVATADAQIAEIEAANADLDTRIQNAQSELALIAEARTRVARVLTQARAELERLEAAYAQAESYARLAHKTPNEGRAIKAASDAKKAMQAARRELDRLAHDDADAEQVARVREQELQKQLHLLAFERDTHLSELAAIRRGRTQAMQELGHEKHRVFATGYHALQKKIDELAEQLVAAQIELHDFHETALSELEAWPEAQRAMAKLAPQEDAVERLLLAARAYFEVAREEVKHLPSALPSAPGGLSFWDVVIPHADIVTKSARYPEWATQRVNQINAMLADWER